MAYAQTTADGFSGADFRIGQVISKSFQVFFHDIGTYSLIAGAAAAPSLALAFIEPTGAPQDQAILALAYFVLIIFFSPLATAINLHAAFQSMRGRPVRLGESVAGGLSRFLPLLGVMVLFTLGVALGLLLLIVPGIILIIMWYVAVPACVVERTGPVRSFGRSRELTKGYRWKIFGLALLVYLVSAIGSMLTGGLANALAGPWGQIVTQVVWQGLSGGFGSVMIAVVYYYLRVAKEGVDVDQIASVFD
jgi:hypothetical protein